MKNQCLCAQTHSHWLSACFFGNLTKTELLQVDCKSLQLEYIYDTVALKAVLSILQKTKEADMKKFFYSSPLLTCNQKQSPIDRAVNVVFSQVDDFQIAFGCDESSPMASTTEKQCRLI
ncbi:hypothetical protein OESDEN_13962 [Oesophagostomum dentatum]|uniref:Uncharacterized protein n=1 Tax=Oesophagostomum dentatum TaxID=61180 RepID=A0A0B1SRY5_OESDE|nr:hypothetical protein OESDEN_13962 [Oesophagostomum dentatum]